MAARFELGINTALNYAKAVFLTREPLRDMRVYYRLHETPPSMEVHWNGDKYAVHSDGQTFVCIGEAHFPLPGCLFPRELATLQMAVAFRKALRWLPPAAIFAGAWVVAQWFLWSIPDSPAEEMRYSLIALVSWWVNAGLIALSVLSVLSAAVWNFGHGLKIRTSPDTDTGLLSAGQPDIYPDLSVLSLSADESGTDFSVRLEDVRRTQKTGQYIVVLAYRNPVGVLLTGTQENYTFTRECPPFDERGVDQIVQPGFRFTEETWREYEAYCHLFADQFREWAARHRPELVSNPIKTYSLEIS